MSFPELPFSPGAPDIASGQGERLGIKTEIPERIPALNGIEEEANAPNY
jgi:hypothetical protein